MPPQIIESSNSVITDDCIVFPQTTLPQHFYHYPSHHGYYYQHYYYHHHQPYHPSYYYHHHNYNDYNSYNSIEPTTTSNMTSKRNADSLHTNTTTTTDSSPGLQVNRQIDSLQQQSVSDTNTSHNKRRRTLSFTTDSSPPLLIPSSPTKKPKVTKSVRFNIKDNKVHHRHYDECDLNNAWMLPSDFHAIKQDNKSTILAVREAVHSKRSLKTCDVDIRGLEEHIMIHVYRRRTSLRNRHLVVCRVMAEQAAQKKLIDSGDMCDPYCLKKISVSLSKDACEKALVLAAIDAQSVHKEEKE